MTFSVTNLKLGPKKYKVMLMPFSLDYLNKIFLGNLLCNACFLPEARFSKYDKNFSDI